MRLEGEKLDQYREEITGLCIEELDEDPVRGLIYFGIFEEEESGLELKAVGAVKNYMGSWYLRNQVVKSEYRGRGLQRQLIKEGLEFLADKTDVVRVSVYPENVYSKRNIEAEGFEFEKKKKLKDGKMVLVYKIRLNGNVQN